MKTEIKIINITVPVEMISDGKYWCCSTTKEGKELLGTNPISQGESEEEAISGFWKIHKSIVQWNEKRSTELNLWKPFQKGNWSNVGGTWFTCFGLNIYFRYGHGMFGGCYIPFTKLNISFNNLWVKK